MFRLVRMHPPPNPHKKGGGRRGPAECCFCGNGATYVGRNTRQGERKRFVQNARFAEGGRPLTNRTGEKEDLLPTGKNVCCARKKKRTTKKKGGLAEEDERRATTKSPHENAHRQPANSLVCFGRGSLKKGKYSPFWSRGKERSVE